MLASLVDTVASQNGNAYRVATRKHSCMTMCTWQQNIRGELKGPGTHCVERMQIDNGLDILPLVCELVNLCFHVRLQFERVQHQPLATLSLHKRAVRSYIEWAHFEATPDVDE